MTLVLALVAAAFGQTAVPSYCSLSDDAPPAPQGSDAACACLRHNAPYDTTDTFRNDWYGDVDPVTDDIDPVVQPDSCFHVDNRLIGLAPLSLAYFELRSLLITRSEHLAAGHPFVHDWEANSLMDAYEHVGDGSKTAPRIFPGPFPGFWDIVDLHDPMDPLDDEHLATLDTNGRGTPSHVVPRNGASYAAGELFVTLWTDEVWILLGPQTGATFVLP